MIFLLSKLCVEICAKCNRKTFAKLPFFEFVPTPHPFVGNKDILESLNFTKVSSYEWFVALLKKQREEKRLLPPGISETVCPGKKRIHAFSKWWGK